MRSIGFGAKRAGVGWLSEPAANSIIAIAVTPPQIASRSARGDLTLPLQGRVKRLNPR